MGNIRQNTLRKINRIRSMVEKEKGNYRSHRAGRTRQKKPEDKEILGVKEKRPGKLGHNYMVLQ